MDTLLLLFHCVGQVSAALKFPDCTNLYKILVGLSAASKLVVEQHRAKLAVLVFDVVLHRCLARSAQLVHLLQVMLVGFNFLIVVLLKTTDE